MPSQNPWERDLEELAGRPHAPYRKGETVPEPERTERREQAYVFLKQSTGQDFGYDEHAWRAWMIEHPYWDSEPEFRARVDKFIAEQEEKSIPIG